MKLPILYSLTSKGQVQTWQIEVLDECFRTHEGIKDGTITVSKWTECKGKNIGRSNETSPAEQADLEAAAKYKKKLDSGYHEKEADIAKKKFFEPMTAKKWKDRKHKVTFPVFSQPKLDGMRCIVKSDGMWSRYGKPVKSAPHIRKQLNCWLANHPNSIFDGELYTHKFKKDFEKIISLAKQGKPTEEDLKNSEKHLEYWVYDYVDLNHPDSPFEERFHKLTHIIEAINRRSPGLKVIIVKTKLCKDENELDAAYEKYLDDGMEGQMIRLPGSRYKNDRSTDLLKRKEFIDEEFKLEGLKDGKGNLADIACRAFFVTRGGIKFDAGIIGSHEYCREILKNKNKLIGKMATVVYQNLTKEGKPRFAKMKIVRDYE